MRTYTYTDGLHETQFNYSSSYQAPDGTIYMGTINGMLSFNPSQFKEDTFMPPMYITGINLPDNEENKYNLPTSSIEDTKVLKLPYNASTFTLSYVASAIPLGCHPVCVQAGRWIKTGTIYQNKNVTLPIFPRVNTHSK